MKTFNEVVGELRIKYGAVERCPLDIRLLVVVKRDSLSEEQDAAIVKTLEIINSALDPQAVQLTCAIRTGVELSVAEYFDHEIIDTERITRKGEEVFGAVGYGLERLPVLDDPGEVPTKLAT